MNHAGSSAIQNNFDFTQPPPGYSIPGSVASKNYVSTSRVDIRPSHDPILNKSVTTFNTQKDLIFAVNSKYAYYPASGGGNQAYKPKPTVLAQDSGSDTTYQNHQLTNASVDPRIYALPPPPPPSDPYPANMAVPPGQYVFNPAVYAAYSVPPPAMASSITGHYITYQHDIYHPRQYQREYNNTGFSNRGGFYSYNMRKRKITQEIDTDGSKKSPRKKKKPLSQNIPSRKDWSVEDARKALDVEREFNKRHKSQHLIIKFPDLELNREIVSKFHPKIDSVHFQQPSTPRFCFVTLKDSANIEEVIKELNKIKFGDGYLTAEPKKDREDDINIGPEDIDPLNLYVGNLAQEVTVEDVVKAYPKNKRIDIGFAKKMKYTRYAFVCFRTVDDAIEAFQNTHATEMYNKSLIVRFRRLHGTVGLPGEPKPQNHQKRNELQNSLTEIIGNSSDADSSKDNNTSYNINSCPLQLKEEPPEISYSGSDDEEDEEELHYSNIIRNLVVNSLSDDVIANIKNEPLDYDTKKLFISGKPIDEKPHVPLLDVKMEQNTKAPIKMKDEKGNWDEKDHFKNKSGTRRSSSESFKDGDYDLGDHNNDPLYGAVARRASQLNM